MALRTCASQFETVDAFVRATASYRDVAATSVTRQTWLAVKHVVFDGESEAAEIASELGPVSAVTAVVADAWEQETLAGRVKESPLWKAVLPASAEDG